MSLDFDLTIDDTDHVLEALEEKMKSEDCFEADYLRAVEPPDILKDPPPEL